MFLIKNSLSSKFKCHRSKKSYEEAFMRYKKGYCIALDEKGKDLTSIKFAKLIQDKNELSFL